MRIKSLVRFFTSIKNFLKKKRMYESTVTNILIVSCDRVEFEEIKHLFRIKRTSKAEFISFDEFKNIDERLASVVQSADLIIIYSTNAVKDAKSLAFSLYVIRFLNYRYLCFIYGEGSYQVAEILKERNIANQFKIIPAESRTELLRIASQKLISVAPLDSLPKILELGVYDGIRNRKVIETAIRLCFKYYLIYNLFPYLALPFLLDYVFTISNLLSLISVKEKKFSMAKYLILPFFFFELRKKDEKFAFSKFLLRFFVILFSIFLGLANLENEKNGE